MGPHRRAASLATILLAATVVIALTPSTASAAARDRTAPTAPTNARLIGVTETSVSLAWDPSTDNAGSVKYLIEMLDRPFSFGPYTSPAATVNDRTLLGPNTTHTLRVRAFDAAGNYSLPSNTVTATTRPDLQPPTTPTNLHLTTSTPHTVVLGWNPSTDNVGWSGNIQYRVSLGSTVVGWSSSLNDAPVRFELRHLPKGALLTFTVNAIDPAGNPSAPANLTVDLPDSTDATPPSAPVLISGVDGGYGEAQLTWTASTDDVTAQPNLDYEFLINGVPVLFNGRDVVYPVAHGTTTAFVTAIGAPGTFTFAVVAVDEAGNISAPSNAIAVTITTDGY